MSGLIPSDFIRDLRERVDIVSYIESTLSDLKKTGQNYTCKCPFHDDKNPSFSVSSKLQSFKCWSGCSGSEDGGDIYKFIQLYHNVSFKESVEMVAAVAGVKVPYTGPKVQIPQEQQLLSKITSKLPSMFTLSRDEMQSEFDAVLKAVGLQDAKHIAQRLGIGQAEVEAYACGVEFGFSGNLRGQLQDHINECSTRFKSLSDAMSFTSEGKLLFPDKSLTISLQNGSQTTSGLLFISEGSKCFSLPLHSEFDESSYVFGMDTSHFPISGKKNPVNAMVIFPEPVSMLKARQKGFKDAVSPLSNLHYFSRGFLNRVYAKRNIFPSFIVKATSLLSGDERSYSNMKAHVSSALASLNKYAVSAIFTLADNNESPLKVLECLRKNDYDSMVLEFSELLSLYIFESLKKVISHPDLKQYSSENVHSLRECIQENPTHLQIAFKLFQDLYQQCSKANREGEGMQLIERLMESYGLSEHMLTLEEPPIKALAQLSHDRITKALIGVCMASSVFAANFKPENIPEGASPRLRALLFSVATTNSDPLSPLSPNKLVSLFDADDKPVLVEGMLMAVKCRHESLKALTIEKYGDVLLKANRTLLNAFDLKNVDDIVTTVSDDVVYTLLNELTQQNLSIGELNTNIILGASL